jgi:hypothetical protein
MRLLRENLEHGDLARLVHNELHIDEFKSKLGDDKDICVISFKVGGKEPGQDLVNFLEKGFDFILDADVSSGEMSDGDYIAFVEIKRSEELPQQIYDMIEILGNLTKQEPIDWRVRYYHSRKDHPLEVDVLRNLIPLSAGDYERKFGEKQEPDRDIDAMRTAAGLKSKIKAPKNDFTDQLKAAAGIT